MSRTGDSMLGLIDDLHAEGCPKQEFSTCRPVVRDDPEQPGDRVDVIYMAWCGNCGAADWDWV